LNEVKRHEFFNYSISNKFLWLTKEDNILVNKFNEYITNIGYEQLKLQLDNKEEINSIGEGKRKIYLVGPCIVGGCENILEDELIVTLHRQLVEKGCNYEIIKVPMNRHENEKVKAILERDIYKNDLVFFIEEGFYGYDLDMSYLYNDYNGKQWLYTDKPIHPTGKGNELIARELIKKIILNKYNSSRIDDDNILLHHGEKQLCPKDETEINEYLRRVSRFINKKISVEEQTIGAIVMTANPFTYGHRSLIKYASEQVDWLYVFVVEEDAFMFSFEARIKLVNEGVRDLANVTIIPSGNFIISKKTFNDYFHKEQQRVKKVNANEDLYIFSKYIAPYFGIKIRFAGEENLDKITKQYNDLMRRVLPKYGIEFFEIRREKREGVDISASAVRKLMVNDNLDKVSVLVPKTTYKYILNNYEHLINRIKKNSIELSDFEKRYLKYLAGFINNHEYVIVYGLGNDARFIFKYANITCSNNLLFCDRNKEAGAWWKENMNYAINVISPQELYENYIDNYIFITTSVYGKEIYQDLKKAGIKKEQILCNVICWWKKEQDR